MDKEQQLQGIQADLDTENSQGSTDARAELDSIQKQIKELWGKGIALADEHDIEFYLGDLPGLPYGSGGMTYNPEWLSSSEWYTSSQGC